MPSTLRRDIASTSSRLLAEARIRKVGSNTIGMEIEMAHSGGEPSGEGETFNPPDALRRLEPVLRVIRSRVSRGSTSFDRATLLQWQGVVEDSHEFLTTDYQYGSHIDRRGSDGAEARDALVEHLDTLLLLFKNGLDDEEWDHTRGGMIFPPKDDLDRIRESCYDVLEVTGATPWVIEPHDDYESPGDREDTFFREFTRIGWEVTDDGSIKPWGKEAVSPIYPIGNISGLEEGIRVAKELIEEDGWEFNNTTGIHIHIGTVSPPDAFYILSLVGQVAEHFEADVYRHFPMRKGHEYAVSMERAWEQIVDDLWTSLSISKGLSHPKSQDSIRVRNEIFRVAHQRPAPNHELERKGREDQRALALLEPDEVIPPASIEIPDAQVDSMLLSALPTAARYMGVNAIPALIKHGTIEFRYFHGDPFVKNPNLLDRLVKQLREMVHNAQTASFIDVKGAKKRPRLIIERARGGGLHVHEPGAAPPKKVREVRRPPTIGHLDRDELRRMVADRFNVTRKPSGPTGPLLFPSKDKALSPIAAAYAKARELADKKTQKARKQKALT